MRVAATAVLVLALAPFLQACVAPLAGGCSREEAPEFSATEEQITRIDVVAALGEPIKGEYSISIQADGWKKSEMVFLTPQRRSFKTF